MQALSRRMEQHAPEDGREAQVKWYEQRLTDGQLAAIMFALAALVILVVIVVLVFA
jgi:hypothetical protein